MTACERKISFPSRKSAKYYVRRNKRKHLTVYKCGTCGEFHLTSYNARQRKAVKESIAAHDTIREIAK